MILARCKIGSSTMIFFCDTLQGTITYHIPPSEKENHRLKSDVGWDMLVPRRGKIYSKRSRLFYNVVDLLYNVVDSCKMGYDTHLVPRRVFKKPLV